MSGTSMVGAETSPLMIYKHFNDIFLLDVPLMGLELWL
jgi:hypothetical protein